MKQTVEVPDYLTLRQMLALGELKDLSPTDITVKSIAIATGENEDEVRAWPVGGVTKVAQEIVNLQNQQAEFFPVFEYKDQLYGYRQLSKMNLSEYIDLDTLVKDIKGNLPEILSILVRPVESHKLKSTKFIIKDMKKRLLYDGDESVFDYYTLAPYNNKERKEAAEDILDMPYSIASGVINFFLTVGLVFMRDTPTYSHLNLNHSTMKGINLESLLLQSTTAGSTRYTPWHKLPSFKSGVKKAYSI